MQNAQLQNVKLLINYISMQCNKFNHAWNLTPILITTSKQRLKKKQKQKEHDLTISDVSGASSSLTLWEASFVSFLCNIKGKGFSYKLFNLKHTRILTFSKKVQTFIMPFK